MIEIVNTSYMTSIISTYYLLRQRQLLPAPGRCHVDAADFIARFPDGP